MTIYVYLYIVRSMINSFSNIVRKEVLVDPGLHRDTVRLIDMTTQCSGTYTYVFIYNVCKYLYRTKSTYYYHRIIV